MTNKKQRRKSLKTLGEQRLATAYAVQSLGQASVEEIHTAIVEGALAKMGVLITQRAVGEAAESLRKQGIFSMNHSTREGMHTTVVTYHMVRIVWSHPPEVARYNKLFPILIQTAEAKELKEGLDAYEVKVDGSEVKPPVGGAGPNIKDFRLYRVRIETTTSLLGAQPVAGNPALRAAIDASPYNVPLRVQGTGKATEIVSGDGGWFEASSVFRLPDQDVQEGVYPALCFERDLRGLLHLHRMCVVGPITLQMRAFGFSPDFARKYAGCPGASFVPHVLTVTDRPTITEDKGKMKGAGKNTYECVPAGQVIEFTLFLPTVGGPSETEWVEIIRAAGENPVRGMSPARGSQGFGAFRLLAFDRVVDQRAPIVVGEFVLQDNGAPATLPGAPSVPPETHVEA